MQPKNEYLVDEGGFQRELHNDGLPLAPGQQVIWTYRPQRRRGEVHPVTTEVAYATRLRVRIRVCTTDGTTLLRWVHAKNLRAKRPDEPHYPYPDPA
jgi:hypothetical protein